MTEVPAPEVTQLLRAWSEGDERALEKLMPLVYDELHRLLRYPTPVLCSHAILLRSLPR